MENAHRANEGIKAELPRYLEASAAETDLWRTRAKAARRREEQQMGDPLVDVAPLHIDDPSCELRRAVKRSEFRLVYQPCLDVTAGVYSVLEALVRWEHPQRGLVPPADFIPLAEETGLIVPIGRWVIGEACRQLAAWRTSGAVARHVQVAVNVSPRQLDDADLIDTVTSALRETRLEPAALCLEITETMFMRDGVRSLATLHALRSLGVTLAMDDFGTGQSSLSHLKRLPVQRLKVDREFIVDLTSDHRDRAVLAAVVDLARALGLSTIVEGVETAGQAAAVRHLGLDCIQGYYLARPMDPDEVPAFLSLRPALTG